MTVGRFSFKTLVAAIVAACVSLVSAIGQDSAPAPTPKQAAYENGINSIDEDLKVELKKLASLRKRIAAEKPQLARKANESSAKLRQKKRQYDLAKATQFSVDYDLEKRAKQLKLWHDERLYINGLLAELRTNYRGSIPLPEAASMDDIFRAASRDDDSGAEASLELLNLLTEQLGKLGEVRSIEGQAVGKDGVMVDGKFAIAGPISWFASDDGSVSGLVSETRSLKSSVVGGTADFAAISKLLSGDEATVSFDPTLGNAIAMVDIEGDLLSYIKKGGVWIYPILALAAVAFLAAIAKWFQLLNIRSVQPRAIQDVIDAVNREDLASAAMAAEKIKHPAKALLKRGIEVAKQPIDNVEEAIYEKYLEAQPALQRGLPLIAIASATSPLLGLLGTVTGMIKTFNQITIFGTGDARSLSGGISEALITTAFGLIVAIPALILHALLSRKIQGIRSTMEMVSLAFINGLKGKQSATKSEDGLAAVNADE